MLYECRYSYSYTHSYSYSYPFFSGCCCYPSSALQLYRRYTRRHSSRYDKHLHKVLEDRAKHIIAFWASKSLLTRMAVIVIFFHFSFDGSVASIATELLLELPVDFRERDASERGEKKERKREESNKEGEKRRSREERKAHRSKHPPNPPRDRPREERKKRNAREKEGKEQPPVAGRMACKQPQW